MLIEDVAQETYSPSRSAPAERVAQRGSAGVLVAIALAAADAGSFALAWAALLPAGSAGGELPRLMALGAVAALAVAWWQRLYPGHLLHPHERLRRRMRGTLFVGGLLSLTTAALLGDWRAAALVAVCFVLAAAIQPLAARATIALLGHMGLWGEPVAILGSAAEVRRLEDFLDRNRHYGIRPAGAGYARTALLVDGTMPPREELDRLGHDFDEIVLLADFPGLRVSGLKPSGLSGEIGISLGNRREAHPGGRLARMIDLAVAVPMLIAVAPVLLIAALAIRRADPGPALYRQMRDGLHGRPFAILKLRTMYQDAEQRLETLLREDPVARAEWLTHYKLRRDPRVLAGIGTFLRSTSIDELPQLLNVIAGDMRLVGPRPFPSYHLEAMDAGFRTRRSAVMPGLTGLWQVTDRSAADIELQQLIDEFYIENRSLWLDIHIIANTLSAVLRGRGAC